VGTLYIVGTPIGNLEDLTLRAARVLGEVSLVAAEDTRRTRQLLTHLGISKPMLSVHADAERGRATRIIEALCHGDVALCTDAGMPAVSDPGAHLVERVRDAGHAVAVIPGPSAVTAALALSGFSADRFVFLGFLPRKASEMTRAFEALTDETRTAVAFESPYRLLKALDIIAAVLPQRACAVARELTKVHEELRTGTADELVGHYRRHPPRGEITILIEGAPRRRAEKPRGRTREEE
jgi:16S rRNA (cytidine1402-2'-O)-methyltransferase